MRSSVTDKVTPRNQRAFRQKGLLGSTMLIPLILIMVTLVSLGVDYSRLVSIRAQLRNAADAAALGGAMQLYKDPSTCDAYAKLLAEKNMAENVALSNDHSQITVNSTTTPAVGTGLGTVQVDIEMRLFDIISPIFGRVLDRVHVTSVAGGHGSVVKTYENVMFPLAVSLDFKPGDDHASNGNGNGNGKGNGNGNGSNNNVGSGISLLDAINGSKVFTIYINSQKYKNGAFTSFTEKNTNANWLNDAIAQCLDIQTNKNDSVTIPSVHIGVDDIYLANGVMGQKKLADDPAFSALTDGRTLILPVISGEPAYNQSRLCIGMVAVQVQSVVKNQGNGDVEHLTVKIVDQAIPGVAGTLNSTGNPEWDAAITQIQPKMIRLLR